MRPMLRSSSWLNDTPLWRTAVNSFTGIEIIPKVIVPLQTDLAIGAGRYLFSRLVNPRASNRRIATRPVRVVRRRHGLSPEALVVRDRGTPNRGAAWLSA